LQKSGEGAWLHAYLLFDILDFCSRYYHLRKLRLQFDFMGRFGTPKNEDSYAEGDDGDEEDVSWGAWEIALARRWNTSAERSMSVLAFG